MSNEFSRLPLKPERVSRLTATCIQTAVRLKLGVSIPFEDALDLSRVHDLSSAVESIRVKLQVHHQIPGAVRVKIAVSEAKMTDAIAGQESIEHIVKLREATFASPAIAQGPPVSETVTRALDAIRLDAGHWAARYGHFIDDLFVMHRRAAKELERVIPVERRERAMSELQSIILGALRRG